MVFFVVISVLHWDLGAGFEAHSLGFKPKGIDEQGR
jgi:hypothetical protein